MSECKISLENHSGSYHPGAEIKGTLECSFKDETVVRAIKIRLKCKECNKWRTRRGKHSKNVSGKNYVISEEKILLGSESENLVMEVGSCIFPFSFTLPYDIPASFNGKYGFVSYFIQAVVDRPLRFDYEDRLIFMVESPLDLDKTPTLQEEKIYSYEKAVGLWCCKVGNVSMDIKLPKTGFLPGEMINFRVNVSNLSNKNIDGLEIEFSKIIKCKVTTPHTDTRDLPTDINYFIENGAIGAHSERGYDFQLQVPNDIEIPNFINCQLFEVYYSIKISCIMDVCTSKPNINISDIKLGHFRSTNYPLDQGGNSFEIGWQYASASSANPGNPSTQSVVANASAVKMDEPSAPPISSELASAPPPYYYTQQNDH